MLNRLRSYLIEVVKNIFSSIAFIPIMIAAALTGMAIFLISTDTPERKWLITREIPFINIEHADTARDLIVAFLAGTISLIIFSFTMMMFVLQQAASNYSSKIIGGIISSRTNQIVLGTYVGTIIYMILTLVQVRGDDAFDDVPQLPIYVGLILFVLCIILFVYFINEIYNSVQIYNVIKKIYIKTLKKLERFPSEENTDQTIPEKQWHMHSSNKSGYFQDISRDALISLAHKHDMIIKVIPPKGFFHAMGEPLFCVDKGIEDKELIRDIESAFLFYSGEKISDNAFFGIRQLSEVAIQSLSTGINAPGIAIACLDHLSQLFITMIKKNRAQIFKDKNGSMRLIIPAISLRENLEMCISPIRTYGKDDLNLMISLLNFYKRLAYHDPDYQYQQLLTDHVNAVVEDALHTIKNKIDRESLIRARHKIAKELPHYFPAYS